MTFDLQNMIRHKRLSYTRNVCVANEKKQITPHIASITLSGFFLVLSLKLYQKMYLSSFYHALHFIFEISRSLPSQNIVVDIIYFKT